MVLHVTLEPVPVIVQPDGLKGLLGVPGAAKGIVIFAHGSGSGRLSPRNNHVARGLSEAGLGTLLVWILYGTALISATRKAEAVILFALATSWTKANLLVRSMPT